MVAHVSLTWVVVVLVTPPEMVVPKEVVVLQREASAGVQSAGLGGAVTLPPGPMLKFSCQ